MKMEDLFGTSIGLQHSWFVKLVEFKEKENGRELFIRLNVILPKFQTND